MRTNRIKFIPYPISRGWAKKGQSAKSNWNRNFQTIGLGSHGLGFDHFKIEPKFGNDIFRFRLLKIDKIPYEPFSQFKTKRKKKELPKNVYGLLIQLVLQKI